MSWVFVGTDFFHRKVLRPSIRRWELLRPILGQKTAYNTQGSTVFREFDFWKFNKTLTNNVVSFEQLGPVLLYLSCLLTDEIEEELAPLIEAQEVKHVDTYEEQINKSKEAAQDLSWIHFLG